MAQQEPAILIKGFVTYFADRSDHNPKEVKVPGIPLVTIVMPIRNEARYIRRSLAAVLTQDYQGDRMEILVVDGMSTDKTREVVSELAASSYPFPSPRILDNPSGIVPTALNIGIRHAQGDVIIRVDGHCEIAQDYVSRCIEVLKQTGAGCVGGPIRSVGETPVASTIALATNSPFGVGGVAFRTRFAQAGYVDTVAFGAYRREVFDRIGFFDEEMVRNQDDEFNFRLTQASGKIYLDPDIRSVYYSRASLGGLWRQYLQYGYWKVRVMQKRRGIASWRHLVPGLFVLSIVATTSLSLATRTPWVIGSVLFPYAVANVSASLWTARENWRTLPLLPLIFAILHVSYGIGTIMGIWDFVIRRRHRKRQITGVP